MQRQIIAFLERLTPRLASAAMVFGLAYSTSPTDVGIYSAGVLALTAFQAISDAAIRQELPSLSATSRFLYTYRWVSATVGAVTIGLVVAVIWAATSGISGMAALNLAPMVLVPAASAIGIGAVGKLQRAHRWGTLARGQLLGSLIALSVVIPILLATQSIVAPALFPLLAELVAALWAVLAARRLLNRDGHHHDEKIVVRRFLSISLYSALAWSQGQADRVLLGIFGGDCWGCSRPVRRWLVA